MLICNRCKGRIFVDRVFSSQTHLEVFCINCGARKFFHNFTEEDTQAQWLLEIETKRAKASISKL